jgi:hypothetical protein
VREVPAIEATYEERKTMRLYGQRNRVALGKSLATGIDIPFVISEVYQIISELVE